MNLPAPPLVRAALLSFVEATCGTLLSMQFVFLG